MCTCFSNFKVLCKSVAFFSARPNIARLQIQRKSRHNNCVDIAMGNVHLSPQPSAKPSFRPSARPSLAPSSNISEFEYLPWVVVLTFFCYFSILAIYKYHNRCICIIDDDRDEPTNTEAKIKFKFEDTFESFLPGLSYVLFIFRFLSFTYIAGVPVISKARTIMLAILFCFI
jgi:hypothetical protein